MAFKYRIGDSVCIKNAYRILQEYDSVKKFLGCPLNKPLKSGIMNFNFKVVDGYHYLVGRVRMYYIKCEEEDQHILIEEGGLHRSFLAMRGTQIIKDID